VIATATDGTVLVWNAAAGRLWGRTENDVVGKKVQTLGLPGLSGDLLIDKTAALREGRSEVERGATTLRSAPDGRDLQLAVEVVPMKHRNGETAGLLYSVQDVTAFRELLQELQTSNEELQSSNEELETTNEELQSANEELQTTNEELQSTNEELETTNEELQSTNAELDATNRELAHRTEEMNAGGYVQRAVIRSLNSAVVVLDERGRVKAWNLAAERLLGIPEDEAVGQLLWTLHIPALPRSELQRIRKSLSQNTAVRGDHVAYELPNGSRGQAQVSAVPLVDGGTTLGSVIILEDATRMATLAAEVTALKAQNGGKRARKN
jgi:two-component system CheB/CheR fusion protein